MTPVLRAAANVLVHVPDLVRYGSKCFREIAAQGDSFSRALSKRLRQFDEAVAYPPNQAFIGNIAPERLREVLLPWHAHPAGGASARGAFGEILGQETFYALLAAADLFGLTMFERPLGAEGASLAVPLLESAVPPKASGREDILRLVESGEALPLYRGDALIGCARRDHETDEALGARILLENLAAKASGAYVLRHLLEGAGTAPDELEYVISCSEEAVGDRYNRGGGNLAKAIAEMAGCVNAAGTDIKSFCAAPVVALIHGAALIQAGVVRNVAIVGGGSLAKLGMKAHRHIEKEMPVLEDVLGSVAFLLGTGDGDGPRVNLEIAGRHAAGQPSTPQGLAEALVRDPLARAGRRICDIDKYAVELHDPGVTLPAGAGDVPRTNYRTLAALAVMAGEIGREDIDSFVEERGMPGFAPTQGHIPAGVPYLGHALAGMRRGDLRSTMVVAKGSLFLGRMSQHSDGASVVIET
ncbi:MAG: glycine/sarcosine/betaine reductase complex component C subunit beta [Nitrospinota bacterium]